MSDLASSSRIGLPQRVFGLLAALWVGSQLTVGYAVAPVLFTTLERGTAGDVANRLFHTEAMIGLVCGLLLLVLANGLVRRSAAAGGWRLMRWLVAGMLACVLVGYFALHPFMESLRVAAVLQGTDVGRTAGAARFGVLHTVSTAFYVIESVLGLILLWKLPARGN